MVDESLSLDDGAILAPGYKPGSWQFCACAEAGKFPAEVPVGEFTPEQRHALLYGEQERVQYLECNTTYQGLIPRLEASLLSKEKEGLRKAAREFVDRAVARVDCPDCGGTRLAQYALESKIDGKNIAELCAMKWQTSRNGLRVWTRRASPRSWRPYARRWRTSLPLGLATSRWTARARRSPAARRNA